MTNNPQDALPRELTKNLSKNLCVCYDVTKQEVIDTIKQGAKTLEEVSNKTYACQGSGCCIRQVERLIELLHPSSSQPSSASDADAECIASLNQTDSEN
ncbi:hypothetical protein THMIRHAM_15320 [Thiomicrorhabdus immobilis]|uniref:BFD-like [2Fe-2S]-binding domain-containing protein n=1 Tax=Thiomicrorhabdus immobilis TaxID=2791037 RepID=A0ABM7MEC1_9GAMM|nr:(2Fe-2S)-binding protein [Thiomicrorhabdus immobilis]BCN93747.1 hypothetical protein THMIRHAM_15320 [Thiomicrorhabdus immobilis]